METVTYYIYEVKQFVKLCHLWKLISTENGLMGQSKSGRTFTGGTVPTSKEVKLWLSTSQIYPDTDINLIHITLYQ